MVAALICYVYGVDKNDAGGKYSELLVVKIPLLLIMVLFIHFLSLNEDIANLAKRMRRNEYMHSAPYKEDSQDYIV